MMRRWAVPFLLAATAFGLAPNVAAADGLAHRWTGCYVGGNAGVAANASKVTTQPDGTVTAGISAALAAALVAPTNFGSTSATFGGQLGCNWQGRFFLFGVEGDFNWARFDESLYAAYAYVPIGIGLLARNQTTTQQLNWFSTIRGRLGYTWDRWLLYATVGLAVGRIKSSFTQYFPATNLGRSGEASSTRVGFTAGTGLEFAFADNWSAKVEYLYVDLGSFTYGSPTVPSSNLGGWATEVDTHFHVVRFGLNYMFWSGGAVAAER